MAHGLETDLVTQGDTAEHALAMMADALQTLTRHQAVRRRPTLRLRPAPKEVWDLAADAVPLNLTARVERRRRGTPSPALAPGLSTGCSARSRLRPVPARYSRLRTALAKLGIRVSERSGKGSHVVVDDGKGHTYPLPLHHARSRALGRLRPRPVSALEIDYQELRKLL